MPGNGRKGAQGKKKLALKRKNLRGEASSEKKGIEERQRSGVSFFIFI
jgi:hypothetical protein